MQSITATKKKHIFTIIYFQNFDNVEEPPEKKTTLSPTRKRRPRLLARRCSSTMHKI